MEKYTYDQLEADVKALVKEANEETINELKSDLQEEFGKELDKIDIGAMNAAEGGVFSENNTLQDAVDQAEKYLENNTFPDSTTEMSSADYAMESIENGLGVDFEALAEEKGVELGELDLSEQFSKEEMLSIAEEYIQVDQEQYNLQEYLDNEILVDTNISELSEGLSQENTYSINELQESVSEAIDNNLENSGYDFDSIPRNEENGFELAKDAISTEIIENAEAHGLTEVEVDGERQFAIADGADIDDWAKESASGYDLTEVVSAGYEEKYDISDSLKDEYGNVDIDAVKAFEDSEIDTLKSTFEDSRNDQYFDIGEEIASQADNFGGKEVLMTREEGIEKALEAGVDIEELVQNTSNHEVLEAAEKSDKFEVIAEYDLQESVGEMINEKMNEAAEKAGVEVQNSIDVSELNNGSSMAVTENASAMVGTLIDNGSEESALVVDSNYATKEEVVEATANRMIDSYGDKFEETMTGGKSFEEAAEGKSESNYHKELKLEEEYNISDSVKELDNWAEKVTTFEDSTTNTVSIVEDSGESTVVQFGEDFAKVSTNDPAPDNQDLITTREEGIEIALEAGMDPKQVAEATSKEEVVEAVHRTDSFEQINDQILEKVSQEEKFEKSETNSDTEVKVEGDHATVKETTMAGEESERVVNRDKGLDEMDKQAGNDSDKVETKEENAQRDQKLSAEEQKILDEFDKGEKTLADGIDAYNSKAENAEMSQAQGQHAAESSRQK
jgi:hypothetical protein